MTLEETLKVTITTEPDGYYTADIRGVKGIARDPSKAQAFAMQNFAIELLRQQRALDDYFKDNNNGEYI